VLQGAEVQGVSAMKKANLRKLDLDKIGKQIKNRAKLRLYQTGLGNTLLEEIVQHVTEIIIRETTEKNILDNDAIQSKDAWITTIINRKVDRFVTQAKRRDRALHSEMKSGNEESKEPVPLLDGIAGSVTTESEVFIKQIIDQLQSTLFPTCLANFSNEKIRERVQTLYVEVILEGRRQQDVAKDLGIGENTASEQLNQLIACMKYKMIERNMLGNAQKVPESYEQAIKHLAQLANREDAELASIMEHMRFIEPLCCALVCRLNALDLATVKQRHYRWKSKATLQAWFTFLDDIHLWADKQLEQNKRYLLAYMKYLFEHKNGSIESFESAKRRNLL